MWAVYPAWEIPPSLHYKSLQWNLHVHWCFWEQVVPLWVTLSGTEYRVQVQKEHSVYWRHLQHSGEMLWLPDAKNDANATPLCHVTLQRFSVNGPVSFLTPCIWVAYDLFWPIDYSISEGVQVLSPNPKKSCTFPPVAGDFFVPWPSPWNHASSRMRDNQSKVTQPKAANPHTWVSLVRSTRLARDAPAVPRCGNLNVLLGATEVLCVCYMVFGQPRAVTNVFHSGGQVWGKKKEQGVGAMNRLGRRLHRDQWAEISASVWRLKEEPLKVYWTWSVHIWRK